MDNEPQQAKHTQRRRKSVIHLFTFQSTMSEPDLGTSPIDLSPAILRGLGDRSYDKRKNAAMEVTTLIKNLRVSIKYFCLNFKL